jgi:hypothetical protein
VVAVLRPTCCSMLHWLGPAVAWHVTHLLFDLKPFGVSQDVLPQIHGRIERFPAVMELAMWSCGYHQHSWRLCTLFGSPVSALMMPTNAS